MTRKSDPELWRPVYGYTGLYEVSNLGRVRNARTGHVLRPRGNLSRKQREIGTSTVSYLAVSLYRKGKSKNRYVHRLVARAFIGTCPARHDVHHKDTDASNNRADNLEYQLAIRNRGRHASGCPCCWCQTSDSSWVDDQMADYNNVSF